jgi:hypothetical protein
MKNALIGIVAASIVGVGILGSVERTFQNCEIYQGYTESDADASVTYIFDPEENTSRGLRAPRFGLKGDSDLKDSLKIRERYCFTGADPIFPGEDERIISIGPSHLSARKPAEER